MPESFDAYQFVDHLRERWRITGIACAVAVTLALAVSLLQPKQYTATARLVIEPPAGSDLRAAMAVSPIYLESLKTYEHFAGSDSLFAKALDHFQLRKQDPGRSIESWKKATLKVGIPRNTKILEISVKLPDPRTAHALASHLAEQTVQLNQNVSRESDQELTAEAGKQLEEARAVRDEAEAVWKKSLMSEPTEGLEAELQAMEAQRYRLERELLDAEVRLAESVESKATARADLLRKRLRELEQELARKQSVLAARSTRREQAETRLRSTQSAYETVRQQAQGVRSTVGQRSERLKVVDPGIVPERPSSPNIPLNVMAAFLAALFASLLYLSVEFGYRLRREPLPERSLRLAGRGRDD